MRRWLWALAVAVALGSGGSGPVRAQTDAGGPAAQVARIRDHLVLSGAHRGGRPVSVTRQLRALGEPALLPMLSHLAREPLPGADLTDAARVSFQVGLIEAVGMRRDPRSGPVLLAILETRPAEPAVDRAVAEALARLGDEGIAGRLLELLRGGGPKRAAVLQTIGQCRRAVVAEALAEMLAERPERDIAALLIRALGAVGNEWAWRTAIVRSTGERERVRGVAARALVEAFVAYDGAPRRRAQQALLLVDHPASTDLVAAARTAAPPELRAALDRLSHKLAHSPLHRRR